jgi:hypothetical protein
MVTPEVVGHIDPVVVFMAVTLGDVGDPRFSIPDRFGHLVRAIFAADSVQPRATRGRLTFMAELTVCIRRISRRTVATDG